MPANPSRRLRRALIGWSASAALWAVGLIPLRLSLPLARRLGRVIPSVVPGMRRLARAHLTIAFGDSISTEEKDRILSSAVANLAQSFCELARVDEIREHAQEYFEVHGLEHLTVPLREGRSVIAITGHIGNWELLASYLVWNGLPIAAVAREIYADDLNRILVDYRARQGIETILRESPNAARQILRALKSATMLAMLIDQDTNVQSVSVPFFGRPARTPAAAATLSLRRGVPVIAIFIERRPGGGHSITVQPPLTGEATGDRLQDTMRLTARFNAAIEAQIRKRPEEWVWWHRRWRRQPVPGTDLDTGQAAAVNANVADPTDG